MDNAAYSNEAETHFNSLQTNKVNPMEGATREKEIKAETKLEVSAPATAPYAGMGKEDLLRFSDTPFWNRLRMACLVIFWGSWLAILGAVIGLTIVMPRCQAPPSQDWWHTPVMYQVYVRSFYDSDADGIGDLKGIEAKLDYISELNADAVILSSIYESHTEADGNPDFGYDVKDHMAINPEYGSMQDFESLLEAAHEKDIKVILDFIPNHTGDQHPWFQESRKSSDHSNEFWNYYMWADCTPPNWPSNWVSFYSGSAWTHDTPRDQCYLHQFLDTQPELNLRSSEVQAHLETILHFWLDKGVDGFRVNSPDFLFEDHSLRDEPDSGMCTGPLVYDCLWHIHTRSLPEVQDLIARWRTILNEYSDDGQVRVLLTDSRNNLEDTLTYYGQNERGGANLPINYQLTNLRADCGGECVKDYVDKWIYNMPPDETADWLTSFQDGSRLISLLGLDYQNAVSMLSLTLPGATLTYYGEEIGMVDGNSTDDPQDPVGDINLDWNRDPYRAPMQWSSEAHCGFINLTAWYGTNNSSQPWLPLNEGCSENSVEVEVNADEYSPLNVYKALTETRRTEGSLQYGNLHYGIIDENIFSFIREFEGPDRLLVAINFGQSDATVNFSGELYMVPGSATVHLTTHPDMTFAPGDEVEMNRITLKPKQGAIFKWPYER